MVAAPLARAERVSLIDALRGVALLGILLMNMPFFALPYQLENPLIRNEVSGPNYWCWWVVGLFFEGSMRGIFSMLFGAGSFLLISRLALKEQGLLPADIYYRRLLWLIVFGLIDAYVFLWSGDILLCYGITGLLFFPFRNLKPRFLIGFAVVLLAISAISGTLKTHEGAEMRREGLEAVALQARHKTLTPEQKGHLEAWNKHLQQRNLDSTRKKVAETTKQYQSHSYREVQKETWGVNVYLFEEELIPIWIWESLGFFLIGLALFKWDVLTGKRSSGFYLAMAVIGYGIALPFRYWVMHTTWQNQFDYTLTTETILPFNGYQLGRLPLTLAHIGLLTWLYKTGIFNGLFTALARVGQMAFTNYLSQSLICTTIFFGYGFGLFGTLERYQIYEVAVAIWVFQLIFSSIWLKYFLFGPFEWVWRSLTYWQRQPMLRSREY